MWLMLCVCGSVCVAQCVREGVCVAQCVREGVCGSVCEGGCEHCYAHDCLRAPSETVVEAVEVCGKCEVVCGEDIEGDRDEWFSAAPNRFYFFEVNICHSCTVNVVCALMMKYNFAAFQALCIVLCVDHSLSLPAGLQQLQQAV